MSVVPRPSVADRGLVLLITALCACLTVAAAGVSVWLRTSADDMAAAAFRGANPLATQLRVTYAETPDLGVPPTAADGLARSVAPRLREHLAPPRHVVGTPEFVPKALPARSGEPAYLAVAGLPDLRDQVELVDGRWPSAGSAERELRPEVAAAYDGPGTVPVMEVVLEVSAAEELDLPIGTFVELTGISYTGLSNLNPVLRVSGTYRAARPFPSALDDLDTARKAAISVQPEFNLVRATALAADDATVLGAGWLDRPGVLWTFDLAGAPGADDLAGIVEEARRAELQAWPQVVESPDVGASTGIGDVAAAARSERVVSDGVVALVLSALAAAALAILLAAAHVLATRRAEVTEVVQARGASARWMVAFRGGEAALLAAPGLLLALGVTMLLGGPRLRDVGVAVGAALACALLVTAAQTFTRLPGGEQVRAVARDSLQLVLVSLAVGATLLVVLGDARRPDDPVVLLLPPLLGVAAAVLLVRGLRRGLGSLRRLARRTTSASPVVSLSQAADIAGRVVVAVAALLLAASAGILALAVGDTLRSGAEQTGWEQAGADVSVTTGGLRDDTVDRLAALPGVDEVAAVFAADSISLDTRTGVEGVRLLGTDLRALSRVGDERLRALELPSTEDGAITAVASPDLSLDDEEALLRYAQDRVPVRVVQRLDRLPGLTDGESFLLVDLASLEAATDRRLDLYDVVLLGGDPDPERVAATARSVDPQAVVRTRAGVAREQLRDPAVDRTRALLPLTAGAAAVLAAFAVALVVGLGRPAGRRTAYVMTALGLHVGQRRRVLLLALLPVLVTICLAAVACGVLLTIVAGAGFDVALLTDTRAPLDVHLRGWSTLGVTGFLVLLVAAAALAGRPASTEPAGLPDLDREHR